MHITSANCGDMLCLYQTGERIRILDVNERTILFERENGRHYATFDRNFNAFTDNDPDRLARFNKNAQLGRTLLAAKIRANGILTDIRPITGNARQEASGVLDVAQQQLSVMEQRIAQERAAETPGRELANAFLSQLYEQGTGSHDTFWGHRVENVSQMTGTFSIDGQRCDYSDAEARLSQVHFKEPHKGLDAQISSADQRRVAAVGQRDLSVSIGPSER